MSCDNCSLRCLRWVCPMKWAYRMEDAAIRRSEERQARAKAEAHQASLSRAQPQAGADRGLSRSEP
jgi:hypothetical protein